jgi:hypothetical protein
MLFTIFCCFSTALAVYCILNRVHRRSVEIAVRLAVRDIEKEYEERHATALAQLSAKLGAKEGELDKARRLVKLHEAVPTLGPAPKAKTGSAPARLPTTKLREDALHVFEMSRAFTDTAYDALLASSEIVKVEPAKM